MRIGIDIGQAIYGTGVSVYTKEIVEGLLSIDEDNEYVLFGGSLRRKGDLRRFSDGLKGKFETRYSRMSPALTDLFWNRLHTLKVEWVGGKMDVYHSSDWAQAPSEAWKVTTVHDLAPIKFPHWSYPMTSRVHQRRLHWVKKEVDRIIVPSKSTRKDLIDLGFDEKRIRVIYEAVDKEYQRVPSGEVDRVKRRYRLGESYLLMVGTGARKNLENIIRGFELSREKERELVITGAKPLDLKEDRGVKYVGYVGDDDLNALYSGADALVYATHYEGFGLPILQAMACECPVVTSNVSSMPEVAGKAAVLVNPNEPDDIAGGIKEVLKNREYYVEKGKGNVKRFGWERAARETLKVYTECAGNGSK